MQNLIKSGIENLCAQNGVKYQDVAVTIAATVGEAIAQFAAHPSFDQIKDSNLKALRAKSSEIYHDFDRAARKQIKTIEVKNGVKKQSNTSGEYVFENLQNVSDKIYAICNVVLNQRQSLYFLGKYLFDVIMTIENLDVKVGAMLQYGDLSDHAMKFGLKYDQSIYEWLHHKIIAI